MAVELAAAAPVGRLGQRIYSSKIRLFPTIPQQLMVEESTILLRRATNWALIREGRARSSIIQPLITMTRGMMEVDSIQIHFRRHPTDLRNRRFSSINPHSLIIQPLTMVAPLGIIRETMGIYPSIRVFLLRSKMPRFTTILRQMVGRYRLSFHPFGHHRIRAPWRFRWAVALLL